jgi:hypothetical protein
MTKAKEFVKRFGDEELMCSAGWVDSFKLHHTISFGRVSGEARGVNSDTNTAWLNAMWSSVHEGYVDRDIFKTGIFLD